MTGPTIKSCELLGTPYGTISSQAVEKSTEGSTTSQNNGIGAKLMGAEAQETRRCITCEVEKPLDLEHFYAKKASNGSQYYRRDCKLCHHKKNLADQRLRKYGVDTVTLENMIEKQQGRCFICERKFNSRKFATRMCVDHDHSTGKVRGLLCTQCNSGLGFFKDSPTLVEKALEYLVKR